MIMNFYIACRQRCCSCGQRLILRGNSGRKSVLEELVLYLIVEKSEELVRSMASKLTDAGIEYSDTWNDWIFDLFGDMDLITQLYSDFYLTGENTYHFAHWTEKNFYKNR